MEWEQILEIYRLNTPSWNLNLKEKSKDLTPEQKDELFDNLFIKGERSSLGKVGIYMTDSLPRVTSLGSEEMNLMTSPKKEVLKFWWDPFNPLFKEGKDDEKIGVFRDIGLSNPLKHADGGDEEGCGYYIAVPKGKVRYLMIHVYGGGTVWKPIGRSFSQRDNPELMNNEVASAHLHLPDLSLNDQHCCKMDPEIFKKVLQGINQFITKFREGKLNIDLGIDPKEMPIFLSGASFGGATVTRYLQEYGNDISGVVSWDGALSNLYDDRPFQFECLDPSSEDHIKKTNKPILVFQCLHDNNVKPWVALNFLKAMKEKSDLVTLAIFKAASSTAKDPIDIGHSNRFDSPEDKRRYYEQLLDFMERTVELEKGKLFEYEKQNHRLIQKRRIDLLTNIAGHIERFENQLFNVSQELLFNLKITRDKEIFDGFRYKDTYDEFGGYGLASMIQTYMTGIIFKQNGWDVDDNGFEILKIWEQFEIKKGQINISLSFLLQEELEQIGLYDPKIHNARVQKMIDSWFGKNPVNLSTLIDEKIVYSPLVREMLTMALSKSFIFAKRIGLAKLSMILAGDPAIAKLYGIFSQFLRNERDNTMNIFKSTLTPRMRQIKRMEQMFPSLSKQNPLRGN